MSPQFQIKNLSFFHDENKILNSLSFSIEKGEWLSIIGPSGAGKTTLLKCLAGIWKGSKGQILLEEQALEQISRKNRAQKIAYVPQNFPPFFFPFTVVEFLEMSRYPHRSGFGGLGKSDQDKVLEVARLCGIEIFLDRPMDALSGGELKKVSLAAAIVQEPKVLLLDEPTTFLDPKIQKDVTQILERLHGDLGVTIVSVTHDLNSAALGSSRILALKKGALEFLGKPEELMNLKTLESVFDHEFLLVPHPQTGQQMILPEKVCLKP